MKLDLKKLKEEKPIEWLYYENNKYHYWEEELFQNSMEILVSKEEYKYLLLDQKKYSKDILAIFKCICHNQLRKVRLYYARSIEKQTLSIPNLINNHDHYFDLNQSIEMTTEFDEIEISDSEKIDLRHTQLAFSIEENLSLSHKIIFFAYLQMNTTIKSISIQLGVNNNVINTYLKDVYLLLEIEFQISSKDLKSLISRAKSIYPKKKKENEE